MLDATKITQNGLNLYAYCLNNPVNEVDENGYLLGWLIALFLLATTAIGAGVGGKVAYDNGARGWELAKNIFLGAALGLAAGGAFVACVAVVVGALGYSTIWGMSVAQIFAIGALAYNFTAFFVAPLFGIDMPGIEFENPSNDQPYNPPEYSYPTALAKIKIYRKRSAYVFIRRKVNDNVSRRIIRK